MSRFLKLTKVIINKNFIQYIDINKDKFIIHLMSNKMDRPLSNTEVNVCKTAHPIDHKTVADWIDNELK